MEIEKMNTSIEAPLISVIIPTYNRANLVNQTLDSVLQQSYQNLEIIIVDDGSTDETEATIKDIADSRICYLRHQKNFGGAKARNTGIEAATGQYIAFLDSDDIWMPNKLELQIASIQKFSDFEKVVIYTQRKFSNAFKGKHIKRPKKGIEDSTNLADYLFCEDGDMQTSTLMMASSLAKATCFRPELKKHQDWDFCLRLEANGATFAFLPEPLTIWRSEPRDDQISRIADYDISINWIKEYRSLISAKATTGFLLQEVLHKLIKSKKRKLYAEKIIFDAWIHKLISFVEFKKLTKQVCNFRYLHQKFKN